VLGRVFFVSVVGILRPHCSWSLGKTGSMCLHVFMCMYVCI